HAAGGGDDLRPSPVPARQPEDGKGRRAEARRLEAGGSEARVVGTSMSLHFNNLLPWWLSVLLVIALLGATVYGTLTLVRKGVAGNWVMTLLLLRLGVFVLFLLILLQPALTYTSRTTQLPELIVLVDTSQSMGQSGSKGTRIEEVGGVLRRGDLATALKGRYQTHWFAFDRTARPIDASELSGL